VDDETVVAPIRANPSAADRDRDFDATYRKMHAKLAAIARRHAPDEPGVQDLMQNAAYKALVRWRSGRPIENLEAYLTTCVLSACMDLHRWSRRQRRALERLASSQEWIGEGALDAIVQQADRDAVSAAFTKLSAECQQLLRLRVVEGVPVKQVAERLFVAEGTVKSKCSRCLDQLDRLMGE
jgi:RNA polymerase sigma-70 factor (ECF subfamily)